MSHSPRPNSTKDDAPETVRASADRASPEPQEHEEYTWGGYLLFLAQRVFLYSVLYVLSIGPFYWQWYGSRFVGGSAIVAAFYQPLVILAEWVPPFRDWIDWYVNLWIA